MKIEIIKLNGIDYISASELQKELQSVGKFSAWIKRCIDRAFLNIEKDFVLSVKQSTGGRPLTDYLLTIESAKRISIVANTQKSKEIIDYLICLDTKVETLQLFTVKQAAFAIKVINCLKYIENQKEAYKLHQKAFFDKHYNLVDSSYLYAEFGKARANIVGWNKQQVDEKISEYLQNHSGYPKSKLLKADMSTKLSVLDINEAIRVACLDILFSKDEDQNLAKNFSNLCKNLAKELEISADKNCKNLFREVETVEKISNLSLKENI